MDQKLKPDVKNEDLSLSEDFFLESERSLGESDEQFDQIKFKEEVDFILNAFVKRIERAIKKQSDDNKVKEKEKKKQGKDKNPPAPLTLKQ